MSGKRKKKNSNKCPHLVIKLLLSSFVTRESPRKRKRERERKSANKQMSVDDENAEEEEDDDDDFGDFEDAGKAEETLKPTPTVTTTVKQQQQQQQQQQKSSSGLEFLSLTDAEFKVAVATAFGGGVSKAMPVKTRPKETEDVGRSEEGEEKDTITKTTETTMETTAEEVSDGEQEERNQREQLPKVGVSIAERMKMFEQQQLPNNQNDAFAGFEDLTVSERGGGQTNSQNGTPTAPPSLSLL